MTVSLRLGHVLFPSFDCLGGAPGRWDQRSWATPTDSREGKRVRVPACRPQEPLSTYQIFSLIVSFNRRLGLEGQGNDEEDLVDRL